MTTYNIVSPGSLVAGQPEDISVVLANFQAIATILNGGLDNANLNASAGIAISKLASYPADATKYARGDGTWAVPPVPAAISPVKLLVPRSTSLAGNSFFTSVGLTAWDMGHWEFVKDVEGRIYGIARTDGVLSTGTLRLVLAANGAGVTRWSVKYMPIKDGANLNPATLTTTVTSQDVTVATGYTQKDITFAISPLATYTGVIFEIIHEGAHANDTLAVNTMLLDASLEMAA